MATPRLIRRLAFQALYQLDAVKDPELDRVRASIDIDDDLKPGEVDKALELAKKAFESRGEADDAVTELAPDDPWHDATQGRRRRGRQACQGIQHREVASVRQRDPRQASQARARSQPGRG